MYVIERFLKCCGEEAKLLVSDTEAFIVRFYPLSKLLRNELKLEDLLFNKGFMAQYIGEDEYIMRIDIECITVYKQIA